MKIIDTFLFFNELDLLEIRLKVLYKYVDYFLIVEARQTFSGKSKPLFYQENKDRFKVFSDKIVHHIIDVTPHNFRNFSPPCSNFTNWNLSYSHKSNGIPLKKLNITFQREVFQRDSIIIPLSKIAFAEDIILLSDLDEIPDPKKIQYAIDILPEFSHVNFEMSWFMYYLNSKCKKKWYGTRIFKYKYLDNKSIDLLRYHLEDKQKQIGPILLEGGWHFSFLGGVNAIKQKLSAYDYQGRRSKLFLKIIDLFIPDRIERNLMRNSDIFGTRRNFEIVDLKKEFPSYIFKVLKKYSSLIKT
jgi:beta-1,4-mannosyl-glycoprotein beta-1,4-N-acetylglucosaminyltransferase